MKYVQTYCIIHFICFSIQLFATIKQLWERFYCGWFGFSGSLLKVNETHGINWCTEHRVPADFP